MSEDKIRVVLLEPNRMAKAAEIGSSLEAMQRVVQGDIQAIYPFEEEVCIMVPKIRTTDLKKIVNMV